MLLGLDKDLKGVFRIFGEERELTAYEKSEYARGIGWSKKSLGKQIQKSISTISNGKTLILKELELAIDTTLIDKLSLQGKLLGAICKDSQKGCRLTEWQTSESDLERTVIKISSANPYPFLGIIFAAIKENSAALGKEAILFDVKSVKQVPEIAKYMALYSQRGK